MACKNQSGTFHQQPKNVITINTDHDTNRSQTNFTSGLPPPCRTPTPADTLQNEQTTEGDDDDDDPISDNQSNKPSSIDFGDHGEAGARGERDPHLLRRRSGRARPRAGGDEGARG